MALFLATLILFGRPTAAAWLSPSKGKICEINRIGARPSESYMIKPGKFWSNYAEDILLISLLMIGILAVYLFAAYFIIAVL
jgi:hypothetical protein